MKKHLLCLLSIALLLPASLRADEGMWLPILIQQKIVDMQKLGFQLSAEDIYSVNKACLKDAIVHFGGGCTGELISDEGLLITNHHCGYGQIQRHSSVEHDYLKDGFWAMNRSQELPNNGLTVTFLRRMEDVTEQVLEGVTDQMNAQERQERISKNSKELIAKAKEGTSDFIRIHINAFYYGNQYFMYTDETFADVRLVAAPPSSIGKFGGDTDNWIWPRHTGDFSIFRVYANAQNNPAEYSQDNVPYHPKKHLTISLSGVKEGDFTMVYGYPGRTQEYVLSPAVDYIANVSDPYKVHLRTLRLDIMNAYQSKSQEVRIQYSSKNSNVSNSWKKWQGESKGILNKGTIAKKQEFEQRFQKWADNGTNQAYKTIIPQMTALYKELRPLQYEADTYSETVQSIEILSFASRLNSQLQSNHSNQAKSTAQSFFKDYYRPIDQECFAALMPIYAQNAPQEILQKIEGCTPADGKQWAANLFASSILTDQKKVEELLNLPTEQAVQELAKDPATQLILLANERYNTQIAPAINRINASLNELYRIWMRAIMEFDKERVFFPDANSTLRVAYGTVQGYSPADGITYIPVSTLEGIMQKDNPEIFDYDIPQSLRDIHATKDFGRWAVNGTIPVGFIATNHTSGGNSGSPVLNAKGHLLGLNFDRVWEGTMSDIEFDPAVCRNISVDIRYVLFVIDRIGHAGYLFDEMTFDKKR